MLEISPALAVLQVIILLVKLCSGIGDGTIISRGEHVIPDYSNRYVLEATIPEAAAKGLCTRVGLTYRRQLPGRNGVSHYVCEDGVATRERNGKGFARNVAKETTLKNEPEVLQAHQEVFVHLSKNVPKPRSKRALTFNDPQYSSSWHLDPNQSPSMGIHEAWQLNFTGQGIVIAVVDTGIDSDHSDLIANYRADLSFDHLSNDNDPEHSSYDGGHGTNCAGIIASDDGNSQCTVGVAHDAQFAAQLMLDDQINGTDSDSASALTHMLSSFDIYSNSWSYTTDGVSYVGLDSTIADALEQGITQGRGGKGVIYTFAAGNSNQESDDTNAQGIMSSPYTITVGSVSPSGSPAYYSTPGASVLASAYGGDLNDNSVGIVCAGRDNTCITDFQGTSAACPVASGIIALALQANPDLTWRDVQHLIVETSVTTGLSGDAFITNGAGHRVSNYFGFGLMNGAAMVDAAKTWENVGGRVTHQTPYIYTETSATYNDVSHSYSVSGSGIGKLEHAEFRIRVNTLDWGDVSIYVTSPAGTSSRLMRERPNCHVNGDYYWDYMSVQYWGESADGAWTVTLRDHGTTAKDLVYWRITMYGTKSNGSEKIGYSSAALLLAFIFKYLLM